jgi:hypothetical protein
MLACGVVNQKFAAPPGCLTKGAKMSHSFKEPTFKGKLVKDLSPTEWDAYRRYLQKLSKKSIKQKEKKQKH